MLRHRVKALERQTAAAPGFCQCVGREPGVGWRVLEPESWRGVPPDMEVTCRRCGLERPTVALEWVDDWRNLPGQWEHITLQWPDVTTGGGGAVADTTEAA